MKPFLLAIALLIAFQMPAPFHPCAGAVMAQSEEKRLPAGHVCVRPAPNLAKTAHACSCHAHDCTKDPSDPANLSAHTDPKCLSYCTVTSCACEKQDCP